MSCGDVTVNNDCGCLAEILKKILLLQRQDYDNEHHTGCDKPYLGPICNTICYNTRPIMLYNCCSGTPWSFSFTLNNQTSTSNVFRIEAIDETAIEYITYRIDDGEEIRLDKNNEGDTRIDYAIADIGRGEHTIYVTAVDSAGNTDTAEQAIIVSSETPEITQLSIDQETGKLIIGVSDVDGIQSIEVNLNGAVYGMDDINRTEATFTLDLVEGTNTLNIKITNVNGLTAEGVTEFEYVR